MSTNVRLTPSERRWRYRAAFVVVLMTLISGLVGHAYAEIFYPSPEFDFYQGARTGASIGFFSVFVEVYYIRSVRGSWIRRVAFLPGIIIRILVLSVMVRLALVGNDLLTDALVGRKLSIDGTFAEELRDTLISMALVIVFVSFSQLGSIIGIRRFGNLVAGRYFKPVEEERAFLFVDLVDSSKLARQLGDVKFHEFLSEFFYQADAAIVETGGEIVSYVGDAVIVTWPMVATGKRNNAPLRTLSMIRERIAARQASFIRDYNAKAEFRAAIHCGPVVVGECGDSRRQVTFLGDVVNMAARIEQACKDHGHSYIVSDEIVQLMQLPENMASNPLGAIPLKGAEAPMVLHSLRFFDKL